MAGYKTYLVAVAMGLLVAAHFLGWVPDAAYQTLLGLLASGGLAALRAGVAKGSSQ